MKEQQEVLLINNPEAAKVLRQTQLPGYFLEPVSPSDVAKKMNIPANLMHHHASRFLELGLLFESKRENGKVFYQLAAKNFKIPRDMLSLDVVLSEQTQNLSAAFIKACERSEYLSSDLPGFLMVGFANPEPEPESKTVPSPEARPAHYQLRSLHLSAARYQELVKQIYDLISAAEFENFGDAAQCTLSFMAFEGSPIDILGDSTQIHSYVPGLELK